MDGAARVAGRARERPPRPHAQRAARKSVRVQGKRLWLGVLDEGGPHSPHPLLAQSDEEGGRGLALVAGLATNWGVTGDETGRIVRAVLDLLSRPAVRQ
ncbi:hypothetical protein ABT061_08440 [Streptosporangium sp. NPDC002544]|uniref:hypothetical protein n=1 Tax=Streptosporangium sp. NPDC002544 TaxID=3154538 RepID=UPI003316CFDE